MRAFAFLLMLWLGAATAHEVDHVIAATSAVSVALSYADGSPFAYEKYELYVEGKDAPMQVGNTDASGRVVFIPGETKLWRLKAYTADGHGVDMRFESPVPQASKAVAADTGPGRTTLTLFGLGVILGVFGLYQLFIVRRKPQ